MFGCESEPARRDSRRKRRTTDSIAPLRAQLLQRDPAVEVGLAREVDDGHAATAELAADLVAIGDVQELHAPLRQPRAAAARYTDGACCTLARRDFYNRRRGSRALRVVPLTPRSPFHADTPSGGGSGCHPRRRGAGFDQRLRLLAPRGPTHHARPERRQHGRLRVRRAGRPRQADRRLELGPAAEPRRRPLLRQARSRGPLLRQDRQHGRRRRGRRLPLGVPQQVPQPELVPVRGSAGQQHQRPEPELRPDLRPLLRALPRGQARSPRGRSPTTSRSRPTTSGRRRSPTTPTSPTARSGPSRAARRRSSAPSTTRSSSTSARSSTASTSTSRAGR